MTGSRYFSLLWMSVLTATLAMLTVGCEGQPTTSPSPANGGSSKGYPASQPSGGEDSADAHDHDHDHDGSEGVTPVSDKSTADLVAQTKQSVAEMRELKARLVTGTALSADETTQIQARITELESEIKGIEERLEHDH